MVADLAVGVLLRADCATRERVRARPGTRPRAGAPTHAG